MQNPTEAKRVIEAALLASYFVDEAQVCFAIYRQWIPDLNGFLKDKGVDAAIIKARNDQAVFLYHQVYTWAMRREFDYPGRVDEQTLGQFFTRA